MGEALKEARKASAKGEIPVGAILARNGEIIGQGHNCSIEKNDPTAHAEIVALREAARQTGNYRLPGTEIYVTLEPCIMCAGALLHARINRLFFGAPDPKGGYRKLDPFLLSSSALNHRIQVREGIREEECSEILKSFFLALRENR